jgi:IS5 family transposase
MALADAEYAGKRKQSRKEMFLIEMDREVLWKGLFTLSERHHPKGDKSVRPILLMAMLRVHQMQN